MRHGVRTLPVPLLLAAAGFTIAVAQDAPPGPAPPPSPQPPGPQDGAGAAPAAPPAAEFKPPAILAQRQKGLKEKEANAAVAAGLDWLRRHAGKDGRWDCDGFDAACQGAKCADPGMPVFDPGVTGLAVLAFLGAGATQVEGADAALVARGLQYFADIQDSEGCFGPRTSSHFQYNHRIATMAVAEALWLTGDEKLLVPATKARDFLFASQNPYLAWRYGVRDGDNDTSNTAYAVLALRTCAFAHIDVPSDAWTGARAWFDKMTDASEGRVGYQQRGGRDSRVWQPESSPDPEPPRKPDPPPKPPGPGGIRPKEYVPLLQQGLRSEARTKAQFGVFGLAPESLTARYPDDDHSSLTACAGAAMTLIGGSESAPLVENWAQFLSSAPPRASRTKFLDLHYMLFGSLFHAQRPLDVRPKTEEARKSWRAWRDAVVADLSAAQRTSAEGCVAGSWNPAEDPYGAIGGRVYSTAMAVLALEAPNRFPKVWSPRTKKLTVDGK